MRAVISIQTCVTQADDDRLLEKEKRIKKEIRRLRRILRNLPKDRMRAVDGLIREAAFMAVTLAETRAIIDREGILEPFEQGTQKFIREHPATKVYNTMINRYASVCKQLFDMIPDKDKTKETEDELIKFIQKAK